MYLPWSYQSEDTTDGHKVVLNTADVNVGFNNLTNQRESLLIIQRGQYPEPEQGGVSYRVLCDSGRVIWGHIQVPGCVSDTRLL